MTKLGKYEIIEEIGRGGFAVVYRARDTDLDRVVALKVLHPYWAADADFVTRFHREARTAARLRHPNIVTVHEAGEFEGQLYIAMEYLPGRNLRELLDAEGALSLERALPILEQVADALDYAHAQGLVHRDVKPGNVRVEEVERGVRATLTDFGLVKAMAGSSVLTSHGTLLGSPEYMAPEQADPQRAAEIGPATDRYGLGIVAYQMLTGRVPFPGNTPATLNAHLNLAPPDPQAVREDLPPDVAASLLNMLAKSPGDRFASARAFVVRLREALSAESQVRERETQLVPLYGQLQAAAAREDWAGVLTLGGQIRALDADYRDVLEVMEQAKAQVRRPRRRRFRETRPVREVRTPLPAWVWVAGGAIAVALVVGLAGWGFGWFRSDHLPASASLHDTWTRPADGMVMVYVPGGTFQMGSDESDPDAYDDEFPQHSVTLDGFWIDRMEVTNAQYRQCVEAEACQAPTTCDWGEPTYGKAAKTHHPVVCVDWSAAVDYCEWAGARLPTEAEWEYAARGPDGLIYPWGNSPPDNTLLNYAESVGATTEVGSYPDGASWCKALDVAGNVWEWVADWYDDYPPEAQANPAGPETGENKVLRGGGWGVIQDPVRAAYRNSDSPGARYHFVGFRCVGQPGEVSTAAPTEAPAERPTEVSGAVPTEGPTSQPMEVPTAAPTQAPTEPPPETPTETPTVEPTEWPALNPGVAWARPADGMVMVYVPPGEFEMGSTEGRDNERPVHTVALDDFWIDQTEVSNAQYRRCVQAGDCSPPENSSSSTRVLYYRTSTYDNYPVIHVTWHQAADYCAWAGAQLPTEAEWEYAARGPEGRVYPWGDEFDGTRLNYCDANCRHEHADETVDDGHADTAPVGSYPGGASWCGALDMAGNVFEWVADWYDDNPSEAQVNPTGPETGVEKVQHGGGWRTDQNNVRAAYRPHHAPDDHYDDVGFRCVRQPVE
jgi:formylglycine-generating enzyme required for sulfatase activity/tRNA A-37 threonylcarbamoyl transferase component Bud32